MYMYIMVYIDVYDIVCIYDVIHIRYIMYILYIRTCIRKSYLSKSIDLGAPHGCPANFVFLLAMKAVFTYKLSNLKGPYIFKHDRYTCRVYTNMYVHIS